MASACGDKCSTGKSKWHGGDSEQPRFSTLRKVRLVCGILFLLLAACLLITSLTLVPVRKAKFRACLRDGLKSGAISQQAFNTTEGLSEYEYFYSEVGYGNYLGTADDPYIARCQSKYPLDDYSGPIACSSTAAVLSVLFAVVFFTHRTPRGLSLALIALLIDLALWVAAYSVGPIGEIKFHDCMKKGLASGAIIDEYNEYTLYYDNAYDPFFSGSCEGNCAPAMDPGIRRCQKHLVSTGTVIALFAFATILGCIIFLYLMVVAIIVAVRRCSNSDMQQESVKGPSNKAEESEVSTEEALPTSIAAHDHVAVSLPPAKV